VIVGGALPPPSRRVTDPAVNFASTNIRPTKSVTYTSYPRLIDP
jgi:hypothetical protein